MSSADPIFSLIRDFGFPVFVALYLLIRLERRMDRVLELLDSLMRGVGILGRSIDHIEESSRHATSPPANGVARPQPTERANYDD